MTQYALILWEIALRKDHTVILYMCQERKRVKSSRSGYLSIVAFSFILCCIDATHVRLFTSFVSLSLSRILYSSSTLNYICLSTRMLLPVIMSTHFYDHLKPFTLMRRCEVAAIVKERKNWTITIYGCSSCCYVKRKGVYIIKLFFKFPQTIVKLNLIFKN